MTSRVCEKYPSHGYAPDGICKWCAEAQATPRETPQSVDKTGHACVSGLGELVFDKNCPSCTEGTPFSDPAESQAQSLSCACGIFTFRGLEKEGTLYGARHTPEKRDSPTHTTIEGKIAFDSRCPVCQSTAHGDAPAPEPPTFLDVARTLARDGDLRALTRPNPLLVDKPYEEPAPMEPDKWTARMCANDPDLAPCRCGTRVVAREVVGYRWRDDSSGITHSASRCGA